ncbi:MAG: glycosyltransferase family 4 protein [Planctomycetota bacterium]
MIARMAEALASNDCVRVAVFPHYTSNPYTTRLIDELNGRGYDARGFKASKSIGLELLRSFRPHVAHVQWVEKQMVRATPDETRRTAARFLWQVRALRLLGVKVVWTLHNLASHDSPDPELEREVTNRFAGRVDAAIAHCGRAAELATQRFAALRDKPIAVAMHPGYAGVYGDAPSKAEARARLSLEPDVPVVLSLGQIRSNKGLDALVREFVKLRDGGAGEARLVIAGSGVHEEAVAALREAAAGRADVRIDDRFLDDAELPTYLAAADVFVAPYTRSLTSGAVLLAMTYGLPCVAPDEACLGEVLSAQGELLYMPDEANGLAEALSRAFAMRNRWAAWGEANAQRAAGWTWGSFVDGVETAYRSAGVATPSCPASGRWPAAPGAIAAP